MNEQKEAPEIPEDLREMYESSKLDTTTFVGSQIRQLIGRIAALTAQRDGLDSEIKRHEEQHVTLRREYDALAKERDALTEQVARLSAPVNDKELGAFPWINKALAKIMAARFDLIIASRTSPAQKEP